jgi:ABC-type transporter Mla subunit MlaD
MAIPSTLQNLIAQLNQELAQTEQEATKGLNLVRELLSRFPDNALLTQFFASFNNVLLFVDIYKRQTQDIVNLLSTNDVTVEEIQEAGEDLGSILGRVLEARIEVTSTITHLQRLL